MKFRQHLWITIAALACAYLPAATDLIASSVPPAAAGFVNGIVTDAAGNRYVTGFYAGTQDFNPGIGADERTALGIDVFVTRFNADNSYGWTQTFGGSDLELPNGITGHNGVIYVVGLMQSNDAFLGGQGPVSGPSGGLISDAFIIAMDAATGAPLLSFNGSGIQTMGGTGSDEALGVSASVGTVFIGGVFNSGDFGIGAQGPEIATAEDGFIVALDVTTGSPKVSFGVNGIETIAGDGNDSVQNLTTDGGFVYAVGVTTSAIANVGGTGNFGSNFPGANNAFAIKLNESTGALFTPFNGPSGAFVFGGTGDDIANSVAVANGNVYIAGAFKSQDAGFNALNGFASLGGDDAFVIALTESTGAPLVSFGANGVKQFGGSGDDTATRLDVLGTTVYAVGFYNSLNAGFATLGGFAAPGGAEDAFVLALDGTTGAPLTSFSDDGVQTFGGSGSEQANGIAVTATQVVISGFGISLDAGVGGLGTISTIPFLGFVLPLDAVTGAFTQPPPPGGGSGTNISDGKPPVVNPLTGVSVKILRSNGGFMLLEVGVNSLNRAPVSAMTDFDDIAGRGSVNVAGKNPSHLYSQAGVFVSTTRAVEQGTNAEKGKMRKTMALSSKETGGSGALTAPVDTTIAVTGMKGKFLFSKTTPDQVSFTGTITLPAGLNLSGADGQQLSIGIGNITDNVIIDPKGKGKLPSEKNRIKSVKVKYPKLAKGVPFTVGGEKATVSLSYNTADMDLNGFDTEGITTTFSAGEDGTKGVPRNIQVAMVVAGVAYESIAPVTFKVSKKGDSGTMSRSSK